MIRTLLTTFFAAAFVVACSSDDHTPAPPPAITGDYALEGVTVVALDGSPSRDNATIVVRGNRIVAITDAAARLDPAVRRVPLPGKFVIPGLIDMHVHNQDIEAIFPALFVANGVTTVREMSGAPFVLAWRDRVARGELLGPRFVVSSPILDGSPSLWQNSPIAHLAIENADQARDAVRRSKAEGYDFLKVYSRLSRESYLAIVGEAKAVGLTFAGHCPDYVPIVESSGLGQSSFEHMYGVMFATSRDEAALRNRLEATTLPPDTITGYNAWFQQTHAIEWDAASSYDDAKASALFATFAKNGTAHVPTLTMHGVLDTPTTAIVPDDPRLAYLPASAVAGWRWQLAEIYLKGRADAEAAERPQLFQKRLALVAAMHEAGVTILAGTDAMTPYVFPGAGLHDELALLVRAGLTPAEALSAATREPARFLGLGSELGTVEQGKVADFVVLDADPLGDIARTKAIHAVVVQGKLVDANARTKLLEDIANAAPSL